MCIFAPFKIKKTNNKKMKKIVIGLLSSLGLGIDASISNPTEYVNHLRMRGFFPNFKLNCENISQNHFALIVASDVDAVRIDYILEGTRVANMDVVQITKC